MGRVTGHMSAAGSREADEDGGLTAVLDVSAWVVRVIAFEVAVALLFLLALYTLEGSMESVIAAILVTVGGLVLLVSLAIVVSGALRRRGFDET